MPKNACNSLELILTKLTTCSLICLYTVLSTSLVSRIKLRVSDKKANKHRPRISAAVSMRRLFEEFRQIKTKTLKSNSSTAWGISLNQKRCSSVQSDCISLLVE